MTIKYIRTLEKDPDADLIYGMDWGDVTGVGPWLQSNEIILSSSWFAARVSPNDGAAGSLVLTPVVPGYDNTKTSIVISGGVDIITGDGEDYAITNRITTSLGQTMDKTFLLKIKNQ